MNRRITRLRSSPPGRVLILYMWLLVAMGGFAQVRSDTNFLSPDNPSACSDQRVIIGRVLRISQMPPVRNAQQSPLALCSEPRCGNQISSISKSLFVAPQMGQTQSSGISCQRVPGSSPPSGSPSASLYTWPHRTHCQTLKDSPDIFLSLPLMTCSARRRLKPHQTRHKYAGEHALLCLLPVAQALTYQGED